MNALSFERRNVDPKCLLYVRNPKGHILSERIEKNKFINKQRTRSKFVCQSQCALRDEKWVGKKSKKREGEEKRKGRKKGGR